MIKPVKIEKVAPYYIKSSDRVTVDAYLPAMQEMSSRLWTYFGYSGLGVPWFHNAAQEFASSQLQLVDFVRALESNDISFYAYCLLILPLCGYPSYRYPHGLFFGEDAKKDMWDKLKQLRSYVEIKENLDKTAHFMEVFFEQQIQFNGKAYVRSHSVIKQTNKGEHFEGYYRVFDRIQQIESHGVSYEAWVKEKFENGKKAFNDEINLTALVNVNKLDPDFKKLVERDQDPWGSIKEFLGLSPDCKITDGYIPKGWLPSNADFKKSEEIVEVRGDGFYFHQDGSQRKGKCHYLSNTYYAIKCDPSNFHLFKKDWRNPEFLIKKPTWDEYRQWAIYPEIWGEDGKSLSGIVKSVKWRKK
jgi:hypothetical protein